MKAAQVSTASFASRHEFLFQDLRDAKPDAKRVLSVGCSSGFELLDLRAVFSESEILGCDVSKKALSEARSNCADPGITIFESTAETIREHGPYDAITCLSVLVRYPDVQDKTNISKIYSFSDFDESVSVLVEALRPTGVLALFNSCYLVEQSNSGVLLEPVAANRQAANGWIDKYDRNGQRLTRSSGILDGDKYPLPKWRQTLFAGRKLTDKSCIYDLAEHRVQYSHQPLSDCKIDLSTTIWRKKPVL